MKDKLRRITSLEDVFRPTQIQLSGRYTASVEGCQAVLAYDDTGIVIQGKETQIKICGKSMFLKEMADKSVIIEGEIESLQFGESFSEGTPSEE